MRSARTFSGSSHDQSILPRSLQCETCLTGFQIVPQILPQGMDRMALGIIYNKVFTGDPGALKQGVISVSVDFQSDFPALARFEGVLGVKGKGKVAGDGEAGVEDRIIIYNIGDLGLSGEIAGQGQADTVGDLVPDEAGGHVGAVLSGFRTIFDHELRELDERGWDHVESSCPCRG
jgi:hypothetical protein